MGFWLNNATQTQGFTNFAFMQSTVEGLVSDAQQGIPGLWFLQFDFTLYFGRPLLRMVSRDLEHIYLLVRLALNP
jgi:hypothetical protein